MLVKKYSLITLLVSICVFTSSCGTIIHGTRQNVAISSNPPGATAQVGAITVTTPATLSLSRDKDYVVNFEKDGCQKSQTVINRSFNGGATILGNILWLLPGVAVDLVAGGAWTLEPDAVNVSLACPIAKSKPETVQQ